MNVAFIDHLKETSNLLQTEFHVLLRQLHEMELRQESAFVTRLESTHRVNHEWIAVSTSLKHRTRWRDERETRDLTVERSKRPIEKKDPVGVKCQIDRIDSFQGRYVPWTVRMLWFEMHFTLAGHNIQFADILHHSIEIDRHDRWNRFICDGEVKSFVVENLKVNEPGRQVAGATDAVGSCCCCWCSTRSASSKVRMFTLSGSLSSPTTSRPRSMSRSYWNEWDSTRKRGSLD